ncbi:MAG: HAMP domain-containing sensor histidine kinase, partial [Patescibacteria group bacterium]
KAVAMSIQKITGAQHVEVFPLYAGGEPLGVMLFVFNRPGAEVHDKNYAIAKAISDDLSLAVQRAQAFEQLKAANEYLAQLDKMKDEFISMASHELNTPLAAIEGYLSMILDEGMGKIDKQSRTYLNRAYASSKRLAELILDLLNVSRIEQGRLKMKYEEVSMAEMTESVIHELQIKADGKKIYLKVAADKDLPKIWCDPDRIREVIVNLTGNAIKFTDKGGITIKISQPDPKNLRVAVTDTGRGIAKTDQPKLFQKFSQVKREVDEHQGSGLGLYISKNFVELHKGKIWVDSDTGKGATFSFEIPLIAKPPKELEGAILEKSVNSPQITTPNKDEVPKIITDSSNGTVQ